MKALVVVGTRPEAVKMAPVVHELRRHAAIGVQTVLCVTGQHRQMLDSVLRIFDLTPDADLDVMRPDQRLADVAAAVLSGLGPVLRRERPDWVLVQGDTTTVAAAALAAAYEGCRVGHVEAGLRTGDRRDPFPEEINRRLAAVVADRHFAPTERACANLLREGVPTETILVTGNTGADALRWAVAQPPPHEFQALWASLGLGDGVGVTTAGAPRLALVTAHRRENLGAPLEQICGAVRELAAHYGPSLRVLFPVHLNPRVGETVNRRLGGVANVHLTPPLDYLTLVHVLRRATLVLTDSGGIQEDAPYLGKPTLVLRSATERPEAVEAGAALLVGANREHIVAEARRLLDDSAAYGRMGRPVQPFGDGHAAARIVANLL